jgi:hypothetical protein
VFFAWVFLNDPNAGLTRPMVIFNVVVFLSGLLVYYIAKLLQSRRGVDVSLSYKELPSE